MVRCLTYMSKSQTGRLSKYQIIITMATMIITLFMAMALW